MPEDLNAEIAESLASAVGSRPRPARARWEAIAQIAEGLLLAIVAIATAWGGYQAARWDGREAEFYARASATRNKADQALTLGGQQRLLDVSTFNTWIGARSEGRRELAALYERRFSPEFKTAFDAWIALDPLSTPDAPPGPSFMPDYVNPLLERGAEPNDRGPRDDPVPARSVPAVPRPAGADRHARAVDRPDGLWPGHDRHVPALVT